MKIKSVSHVLTSSVDAEDAPSKDGALPAVSLLRGSKWVLNEPSSINYEFR